MSKVSSIIEDTSTPSLNIVLTLLDNSRLQPVERWRDYQRRRGTYGVGGPSSKIFR